jgi:hypothetical protein
MSQGKGVRFGWILVSYFMIAGGFILVGSMYGLMKIQNQYAGWAFYFLGAAFGGFFAGRASEGRTIIEPAVGGVLLMLSIIGLIALVPGVRKLWSLADKEKVTFYAVVIGVLIGAGGLIGATLGERTAPDPRPVDRIRWMGVSALITLGMFFFVFVVMAILMLRDAKAGSSISDDTGGTIVLVSLAASAFFGGFVTQAVAPEKMNWACGAGFMVVILAMIGLVSAQGKAPGDAVGGMIILGGLGTIVGALGALVGWATIGKNAVAASQQSAAPAAFE